MGTNASTQQDVSPATQSTIPSQSMNALSLSPTQKSHAYSSQIPLNLENLDSHTANIIQQQQPILSPTDGYKWRKYGQKQVKGSDYPRNYYKCTFPGCSVKKYVEKCEEDGKTLERVHYRGGEHTHDPSRITRLNAIDQSSFKQSVLSENLGVSENKILKLKLLATRTNWKIGSHSTSRDIRVT
jgi:hypothetical protein